MGETIGSAGLIVLGALISLGTTFLLERRKEQRADKAENQERDRQLQQASRLVREELADAQMAIYQAREFETWWSTPPHDFERSAWMEYKSTLAGLLDTAMWSEVSATYSYMAAVNVRLAMGRAGKKVSSPFDEGELELEPIDDGPVTDAWMAELGELNAWLTDSINSLDSLLGTKKVPDRKSSTEARANDER